MEIYTDEDFAGAIIKQAKSFNIDAQIIGRVEAAEKKELVISVDENELLF
jgi:phosphoribosylformylglycinamidine cyclo-ligase